MKLNEVHLNEDMGYGQAIAQNTGKGAIRQLGGALKSAFSPSSLINGFKMGPTSMDDANVDTMAKTNFINKTIGQIISDLDSGIQSGLVNPDPKATSTTPAQPGGTAGPTPPGKPGTPTPAGGKAGPGGTAGPTPPGKPGASVDPGQTHILANPKTPDLGKPGAPTPQGGTTGGTPSPTTAGGTTSGPKTPEQIRKEKQAAAGQVAQQQMAANPAPAKPGAPAAPKTPEQIRQEKQAAAAQTAQGQMAANPAPTQQAPAQQTKMTPQQVAALKGRLKAGATATSGQSGFKNYVGGSGERMTGVDKSGAPVFKKIQREGKFSKLDAIFESIVSLDEDGQQFAFTISSRVQHYINRMLGGASKNPGTQSQIKALADEIQATYAKDKGKAAISKLANLVFASMDDKGAEDTASANDTTTKPADSSTTGSSTAVGSKSAEEVLKLLPKLSKEEKQKLLTYVETGKEQEATTAPATATPTATTAPATATPTATTAPATSEPKATATPTAPASFNAANVMKLPGMEKYATTKAPATPPAKPDFSKTLSGYGKTTMNAPAGIPNPIPNMKNTQLDKIQKAKQTATAMAEGKSYKVWGQK